MTALDEQHDPAEPLVDGEREPFYRGPGRGDGHRRRSIEWHRQHDVALTIPCPLEIPHRREPDGVWRCGARVGEECVTFPDRTPLGRQPAHNVRIFPRYARPAPTEETTS